jgi:hypothetical protein
VVMLIIEREKRGSVESILGRGYVIMVCRREVYLTMKGERREVQVETSVVESCKSKLYEEWQMAEIRIERERKRGEASSRVCGRGFASSRSMGRVVGCQTRDSRPITWFKNFFVGRVHVFDYGGVRL